MNASSALGSVAALVGVLFIVALSSLGVGLAVYAACLLLPVAAFFAQVPWSLVQTWMRGADPVVQLPADDVDAAPPRAAAASDAKPGTEAEPIESRLARLESLPEDDRVATLLDATQHDVQVHR